ncbi:MAG: aspartyl-tRNA(Asn)/glutamyl-tRNA (Gln) amidotransferase subunit C [Parcubacteria group bacterium LiPW_15]|nr:MAG: aspartyl-tRNA(Asn)/glutamyl-tRNA (Gln) amidotransferase subunit C [Parcubacteria group bacterium LiPW_15]
MPSPINKKVLQSISGLARLELQEKESEKILEDLRNILDHFNELQELDTSSIVSEVIPERDRKIFREDDERIGTNLGAGKELFPRTEDGFLAIPPVFKD